MMKMDDAGGGYGVAADFSTLFGGGGGGSDLSATLGGLAGTAGGSSGGFGSFLGSAASGAAGGAALGPYGAAAGAVIGGITSLFASHGVPDHERGDLGKIAFGAKVSEQEASWVCGDESERGSDNYDDVCRKYANDIPGFLRRVPIYNSTHPQSIVKPGPSDAQLASQQQQLISTATSTLGFGASATGQQLINTLQALPTNQTLGTQGQTAGDILGQIVKGIGDGALKGGSDAAAETDLGKSMKKDYIQTWAKENQLLAAGIGAFGIFGLVELYKKFAGKGGKISL
jgi:hypothetical protein